MKVLGYDRALLMPKTNGNELLGLTLIGLGRVSANAFFRRFFRRGVRA